MHYVKARCTFSLWNQFSEYQWIPNGSQLIPNRSLNRKTLHGACLLLTKLERDIGQVMKLSLSSDNFWNATKLATITLSATLLRRIPEFLKVSITLNTTLFGIWKRRFGLCMSHQSPKFVHNFSNSHYYYKIEAGCKLTWLFASIKICS